MQQCVCGGPGVISSTQTRQLAAGTVSQRSGSGAHAEAGTELNWQHVAEL